MSNKHYWVSYERGEGDPFEASSLSEVKRIITGKMNHVLTEDGRVAGGYKLHRSNGRVIHSGGEFRLINGKVKYFPDYIEEY